MFRGSKTRNTQHRRFGSKRSFVGKGSKTEVIRKSVPRISTLNKKIKRIEDTRELKAVNVPFNQSVTGAQLQLLNSVPPGTGIFDRVGDEIQMTSLQFRGQIIASPARLGPTYVRMIIFWDRQANGAVPIVDGSSGTPGPASMGVLDNNLGTVGDFTIASYLYTTQDRYRVLYDKRWCLNPVMPMVTTPATGDVDSVISYGMQIKKKIKLNRRVKYNGTSNSVTDIVTNSLYALFIEDNTGEPPEWNVFFRSYFKDA